MKKVDSFFLLLGKLQHCFTDTCDEQEAFHKNLFYWCLEGEWEERFPTPLGMQNRTETLLDEYGFSISVDQEGDRK